MAVELEAIQGVIKLKDEYTETLETVHKNLEKFGGEHAEWVKNLVSGEALVATAFVAAGAVVGAELVKLGNEAELVGEQIGKMGMQFNVPVEALSDLRFAVTAAGGDFDTFGNSMFMFQKRLEDNSDAVDKGLQKLGLSVSQIKDLRPDEQFLKISDAVRAAGSDVNKSAVAFEIFGRSGRDILPLLMKPLSDLTEESHELGDTWSQEAVQAAREFRAEITKMAAETEETWTVLGRDVAPVTNELTLAWGRMKLAMANVALTAYELISLKPIAGWLGDNALAAETAAAKQDVITKAMALGADAGIKYSDALKYVSDHYAPVVEQTDKVQEKLESLRTQAMDPLSTSQQENILELQKFGVSLKDIADLVGSNVIAVKGYIDANKEHEAAIKKAADATAAWDKVIGDLVEHQKTQQQILDEVNGSVVEAVKYYLQAGVSQSELAKAYGLTNIEVKAIDDSLKSETASTQAATKAANEWAKVLSDVEFGTKSLGEQVDTVDGTIVDWAEHLLQSGVAAKEVAEYYGLTDNQVKALQADVKDATQVTKDNTAANQDNKDSIDECGKAIQLLDGYWVDDADIAQAQLSKIQTMVKTLAGDLISLSDAKKRLDAGGTQTVTSANFADMLKQFITSGGWNPTGAGVNQYHDPYDLAKKGYSFSEVLKYAFQPSSGSLPPAQGPRIPGFAEGGTVMVGEEGPEVVRLPLGSTVYPTGTTPGNTGGPPINITFYVNGTASQVAQQIKDVIMRELKQVRQFGAA